jgi:hypothetical protein
MVGPYRGRSGMLAEVITAISLIVIKVFWSEKKKPLSMVTSAVVTCKDMVFGEIVLLSKGK